MASATTLEVTFAETSTLKPITMKKMIYAALLLLGLSMTVTSCVSTYDVNHQKNVYRAQMSGNQKSLALMNKIPVYFSEAEVGKEFVVVNYCTYQPLVIPIIRPERKPLTKKLYKKAVTTAEKLKGDAVIIDTKNSFRVIKMK